MLRASVTDTSTASDGPALLTSMVKLCSAPCGTSVGSKVLAIDRLMSVTISFVSSSKLSERSGSGSSPLDQESVPVVLSDLVHATTLQATDDSTQPRRLRSARGDGITEIVHVPRQGLWRLRGVFR